MSRKSGYTSSLQEKQGQGAWEYPERVGIQARGARCGVGLIAGSFCIRGNDYYIKLQYLRSRWYSTSQGRFISRDVWQGDYNRPSSLNRWNYVEANPINYIDPSGYWRWWLAEPMYHTPIENYYEQAFGMNPNKQLEFPLPGTPFRHPDMFNSFIGDVYEIEPFFLRASGALQVTGYVSDLTAAANQQLLKGKYLLSWNYDWNTTPFHVGTGVDWPGKFRQSPLSVAFPFVDLA